MADTLTAPDPNLAYDSSMAEGGPISDTTSTGGRGSVNFPTPSSTTPRKSIPEPNLDRAYHTIDFLQRNPQWLSNPYTTHAANALLANSSRMIEQSIQLERVNSQLDATKLRLNTDTRLINHLNDGLLKLEDLSKVAAIREEIQANGPSALAVSMLNSALKEQNASLEPQPTSMTLDDGTEVQGWIDPKTRKFTQFRPPSERASGASTQYPEPVIKDIGGRPFLFYRNFSPKALDRLNAQQQEQVKVNSAALKQARVNVAKAPDAASRAEAQKEYDRQLGIFNDYFDVINAQKGLSANAPAPTATQPSAPQNPAALKADEANKIASENPGWTRKQIIDEVERRWAR